MKFAHLADCHIGGWREEKLKDLNLKVFQKAIDSCIKENAAFVLISGDLFNTSLPSIDLLKEVAFQLEKLRSNDIDVYIVPGSHDFSPSGKTMLDVLENAGLMKNVSKKDFTIDKTNTKIIGILGRRQGLEKEDYKILDKEALEKESGFKIFLFHSLLNELKTKELEKVEGHSLSLLPKNFNYYAGGHPHIVHNEEIKDYGLIAYPGALFPNNFLELEKFNHGGFYIVDDKLNLKYIPIKLKDVLSVKINANNKYAAEVEKEILSEIKKINIKDNIVTLRVDGILASGKPSDINFKEILANMKEAFIVLKNTANLTSKEFEELKVETGSIEEIEDKLIKEHLGQIKVFEEEEKITKALIESLNKEKEEGEKNIDFENRLVKEVLKILELEDVK